MCLRQLKQNYHSCNKLYRWVCTYMLWPSKGVVFIDYFNCSSICDLIACIFDIQWSAMKTWLILVGVESPRQEAIVCGDPLRSRAAVSSTEGLSVWHTVQGGQRQAGDNVSLWGMSHRNDWASGCFFIYYKCVYIFLRLGWTKCYHLRINEGSISELLIPPNCSKKKNKVYDLLLNSHVFVTDLMFRLSKIGCECNECWICYQGDTEISDVSLLCGSNTVSLSG